MAAAAARSTCRRRAAEGRNIPAVGWEGSSLAGGVRSRCSLAAVGNSARGMVEVDIDPAERATRSSRIVGLSPGRETVQVEGMGRRLGGSGEGKRAAVHRPGESYLWFKQIDRMGEEKGTERVYSPLWAKINE